MSGGVYVENVLKSPFEKKEKKEAKSCMLLWLIASDVYLRPVCFLSEVELGRAGQRGGLSTDEQARAASRRKGIVGIRRFHFDRDDCSADAAFLFSLQGDREGG